MKKKEESRSFSLQANGIEMTMPYLGVVARDILKLAEERGAIPGKPEDYILQGDKGQYGWDNWVDLEEDNRFITIPNQPTLVA